MKWLFSILVALNIIVFGSMVAGKLIRLPQPAATAASQPTPTPVAASATEPVITVTPVNDHRPATAPLPRTHNAPPGAKPTATRADNKTEAPAAPAANCSASAVLPEDDYHRIKGLLSRWPHAASRFVEQNQAAAKPAPVRVRYMVSVDGGADVRERLKEQGFDSAINNGLISLGVFNRKSDAETLLARAKISGISQAQITQLGGGSEDGTAGRQMSVAKMRVTFIQVDDQAAHEITQLIQRYGRLQRGACKK